MLQEQFRPVTMPGRSRLASQLFALWLVGPCLIASVDAVIADQITPVELCFRKAYAEKLTAVILNDGVGAIANTKIDQAALLSACAASSALGPKALAPDVATPQPSGATAPESSQKPLSPPPIPTVGETPQPDAAKPAPIAGSVGLSAPPKTGWVNKPAPNASNPAGDSAAEQNSQPNAGWANKPAPAAGPASADTSPRPKTDIPQPPPSSKEPLTPPAVSPKDDAGATPPPHNESPLDDQPGDTTVTDGPVADKPDQPAAEIEDGLPPPVQPTPAVEDGLPLPVKPTPQPQATNPPDKPKDTGAATGEVGSGNPADIPTDVGAGGGLLGGLAKVGKTPEESTNKNTPSAAGGGPSDTKATEADTPKVANQPTSAGKTPNQTGGQNVDTIEAQQQEALRTVQSWRANGSPAWFKSGLPIVKKWLGATDWTPDAGDYFAAEIVRFGLYVMWLDNEYRDRVKNVDAAAESCSKGQWDIIDSGFGAGTKEAAQWVWEIEFFRNEILGDLQRSCNRLQHELSLGCGDLVPFDSKGDAVFKSANSLRQDAVHFLCCRRGSSTEEYKTFFREDYGAALKARNAKIDPEIAALEPILQQRAKAIEAALAKVGSVETKRTMLGLGAGTPNPAARTLRAKLQNISVYEKVMRVAAGRADGAPRNRWSEYEDALETKTKCEVCWGSGECSTSGSSGAAFPYDTMPGFLPDLLKSVEAERLILRQAMQAETAAEFHASDDERNRVFRDKIRQAYEEAKAKNAEAQAKRGTAEDPDGKLADKAAADEVKAKHDLDLSECIDKKAKALQAGPRDELIAKWGTMKADCEAQISGKAVASNAPPSAPAQPKNDKPPLPPVPPQPEGAKPSAGGPLPPNEPPAGAAPPQSGSQAATGGPPAANPKTGGAAPAGLPKQLTGLPVAAQGGNPAGAQKPGDAPLSPEQFGKAIEEAMEKLGVKPRAIAAGEPLYNEFSPWLAQKAGLDVQTAIVAAAFQEKVPIDRLMEVTKLSRDDVAKSLDVYLQSLKGITSADERSVLVGHYMDSSQAAGNTGVK